MLKPVAPFPRVDLFFQRLSFKPPDLRAQALTHFESYLGLLAPPFRLLNMLSIWISFKAKREEQRASWQALIQGLVASFQSYQKSPILLKAPRYWKHRKFTKIRFFVSDLKISFILSYFMNFLIPYSRQQGSQISSITIALLCVNEPAK